MLEKDDKIGDYSLVKFLGKGQFGEVWLAEKALKFSNRKFHHALKFIANSDDEINLRDVEAEIDTWISASGHPNVMPVLDMLVHRNSVVIVSEYADGGSLKDWLKVRGGKAGLTEKALEMTLGVLRGIEHLHARTVVHRDLKPDNILLQGEFPRITDFGISRIVSENTAVTRAMGSPAYMSPEAFQGSKSPQTDIWSAGVILYEMLSGAYPFTGADIYGLRDSIYKDEPHPLPEYIEPEICGIVYKALEKQRDNRYKSAVEMRSAVEKAAREFRPATTNKMPAFGETEWADLPQPGVKPVETADMETERMTGGEPTASGQRYFISRTDRAQETQSSVADETRDSQKTEKQARENEIARGVRHSGRKLGIFGVGAVAATGLLGFLIYDAITYLGLFSNNASNMTGTTVTNSANPLHGKGARNGTTAVDPPAQEGMVYVEGGEFRMGRDDGDLPDEKPSHPAAVGPFFIDIYEVTNEQYAEFVKATRHSVPLYWKNGTFAKNEAKFPVVGVTWNDAGDYADWAGKRLPTEEEWEFAARGGQDSFLYPWGNEWVPDMANVAGASRSFAEVGKFRGRPRFEVYDMVGNAGEWTASDFKAYPNGRISGLYEGKKNLKVIRGGSFINSRVYATTTYRIGWAPTGEVDYSGTGFRCAKESR
jgi:formylglycine-generating enzyme required for sulfatase activity